MRVQAAVNRLNIRGVGRRRRSRSSAHHRDRGHRPPPEHARISILHGADECYLSADWIPRIWIDAWNCDSPLRTRIARSLISIPLNPRWPITSIDLPDGRYERVRGEWHGNIRSQGGFTAGRARSSKTLHARPVHSNLTGATNNSVPRFPSTA